MKLDEELASQELTNLMKKKGVPNVIWTPAKPEYAEIPITIENITPQNHPDMAGAALFAHPEGLIGVYGRQCLLYIPFEEMVTPPSKYHKFHLKECHAIREMKEKGKFERYTVTNRTSGFFLVNIKENFPSNHVIEKREVRLNACRYCINELGLHGYGANDFDIKSFFEKYRSDFASLPSTYNGISEDVYPPNWEYISKGYRTLKNWRCEICNIDLSEHEHLLHVHHKNGVKRDTRIENLIALCKLCHTEQFQHEHMTITPEEKEVILSLRERISELERRFRNL